MSVSAASVSAGRAKRVVSDSFAMRLLAWYDREKRSLPWREDSSAYRTLVSELMLQQTVVATVIPFFQRFCARFPSVQALADAREDEVLEAWSGLGYYRRARHLHAAARAIVGNHGGLIPSDEVTLRSLPGVGPYTAAAVAAIAFGERAFALDGNAGRVMARLSGEREAPLRPAARQRLHAFGLRRVPTERAGDFAQAVMELGATVCTPTSPSCERCPVRAGCVALEEGLVGAIPAVPPRKEPPKVRVACLRIEDEEGRIWLERRGPGLLAGTLAMPMEALESDEVATTGALRLWQRLGGKVRTEARSSRLSSSLSSLSFSSLGSVRHVFTHRDVTAEVLLVRWRAPKGASPAGDGRWCAPQNGASWGGGVSTFTRKTLSLEPARRVAPTLRKTRQPPQVKQ